MRLNIAKQRPTQHKSHSPFHKRAGSSLFFRIGCEFVPYGTHPNPALYTFYYVLKNKRLNTLYIGYTYNLKRRLDEHQKNDKSMELVYYESYTSEEQALERKRKVKLYGGAGRGLKKRLGL